MKLVEQNFYCKKLDVALCVDEKSISITEPLVIDRKDIYKLYRIMQLADDLFTSVNESSELRALVAGVNHKGRTLVQCSEKSDHS